MMHKVQIRSEVWMAYEDHFFGKPWTTPATVVMGHGNSESSRAWSPWVPHLAGTFLVVRLDLPGLGPPPSRPIIVGAPPSLRPTLRYFSMRSTSNAAT